MRSSITAMLITLATVPLLGGAADGRLTGENLRQAISGKAYTGATRNGGTWKVEYAPDGSMKVVVLDRCEIIETSHRGTSGLIDDGLDVVTHAVVFLGFQNDEKDKAQLLTVVLLSCCVSNELDEV